MSLPRDPVPTRVSTRLVSLGHPGFVMGLGERAL